MATSAGALPTRFGLGSSPRHEAPAQAEYGVLYPKSVGALCDIRSNSGPIEQGVNASDRARTYDGSTGRQTFLWKTDKSWPPSCRRLTSRPSDGTDQMADSTFTK